MTRVDFYILEQQAGRQQFVCRLAEKAFSQGHKVYIHTTNAEETRAIDQLLWTFRDGSFVPHDLAEGQNSESLAPIHIGHDQEPLDHNQVLINLAKEIPLFFSRFERVAEIVDNDDAMREQARERFRFYRERGYELNSHNIS